MKLEKPMPKIKRGNNGQLPMLIGKKAIIIITDNSTVEAILQMLGEQSTGLTQ